MKLRYYTITGLIISGFLLSCSGKAKDPTKKDKPKAPAIDISMLDSTYKPDDDFFEYVNSKWIEQNPIPASKSSWGMFSVLVENSLEILKDIQEDAAENSEAEEGSNTRIIGDFYASGMDSSSIDNEGITPLQPMLDKINGLESIESISELYADYSKNGMSTPIEFGVEQDFKNTTQYISFIWQGGLGLPDRDYYLRNDEKSEANREAYKKYVESVFTMSGSDESTASTKAANVYEIELALAKGSMTLVEQRNPQAIYNKMSVEDLKKISGNFNWDIYFNQIGASSIDTVIVGMPGFIKAWNALLKSKPLEKWKDYYTFHLINSFATELSAQFDQAHFDFYDKQLKGVEAQEPRWKRITGTSDWLLRDLLGQEYVKVAFDENSKKSALELVENLRDALRERIDGLTWMGDSTKQKAQEKLKKINVKIGYPDSWRSYDGIEVKKQSYVLNVMAAMRYEFQRDLNKLGKPIDKTEWGMGPQTVNAYYNPLLNEIVFPAAILQPPFFDADADEAVNYGGIGMVIGHELTHGFDDMGSQFDADGNLNNWWTEDDARRFNELTQRFIDQYNGYFPVEGVPINGELTVGENIADLGGMIISYSAFKKATADKPQDPIDGLTPDQRYFINFAQIWRTHYREDALLEKLYTDPHSPAKYRVIGTLTNFPAFYDAFNVTSDSKMYTPDSLRCIMW